MRFCPCTPPVARSQSLGLRQTGDHSGQKAALVTWRGHVVQPADLLIRLREIVHTVRQTYKGVYSVRQTETGIYSTRDQYGYIQCDTQIRIYTVRQKNTGIYNEKDRYGYLYHRQILVYTVRQTCTYIYIHSERQIRVYAVQLKVGLHISVVPTVVLVVPLLLL